VVHHIHVSLVASRFAYVDVLANVASYELLERADHRLSDVRRAHDNAAHDAEVLGDPMAGDVVSRGDDDPNVGFGSRAVAAARRRRLCHDWRSLG
jgi:hypothetical protein